MVVYTPLLAGFTQRRTVTDLLRVEAAATTARGHD
jgi:hypothetical protein